MIYEDIPKGGMCAVCTKQREDCSQLPFDSYRVLYEFFDDETSGDVTMFNVVRCEEWERANE